MQVQVVFGPAHCRLPEKMLGYSVSKIFLYLKVNFHTMYHTY